MKATIRAARANTDIVRGVKAHAEIGGASRWGLEVVKLGKRIANELGIPLYIHLGQLWPVKDGATIDPDEVVRALMPLMEPGDVLAHPFTRHPGGFVSAETGEVHPVVWAALERGVTVDVGHGSHFSFEMARRTLGAGIRPHTLGADMHGYNVRPPGSNDEARQANPFFGVAPFNLTHAMTELLTLGMSLPDIVATVTANPARMLQMQDFAWCAAARTRGRYLGARSASGALHAGGQQRGKGHRAHDAHAGVRSARRQADTGGQPADPRARPAGGVGRSRYSGSRPWRVALPSAVARTSASANRSLSRIPGATSAAAVTGWPAASDTRA